MAISSTTYGTEDVPQSFTLDGKLYSDAASTTPLLDSSIALKIQVLDEGKTCVLYEESQTVNTLSSSGYFTIQVGSSTGDAKRTSDDSGNTMANVFQNIASVNGKLLSNGNPCTIAATAAKRRYVRITVAPSTMGSTERALSPDLSIDSVPNSIVAERAESLQGVTAADVLQVKTSGSNVLTQTNLENLFSTSARFNALTGLVDGTSGLYMRSQSNSGANLPVIAGAPTGPTQGSIWYDSTDNKVKYRTGTATTEILSTSASAGTVTSVGLTAPAELGVTGAPVTTSGTIALSWANQTTNKVFAAPNGSTGAPTFRALVADDVPSLPWSKITSGTPTTLAGYGITDAVQNTGNVPSMQSGLDAGKPAASLAGRIYIAYDTAKIYRDNGTTWDTISSHNTATGTGDILNGGNTTGAAVTIGTNDAQALNFETNGSTRMTIGSAGNVSAAVAGSGHVVNASSTYNATTIGSSSSAFNGSITYSGNQSVGTIAGATLSATSSNSAGSTFLYGAKASVATNGGAGAATSAVDGFNTDVIAASGTVFDGDAFYGKFTNSGATLLRGRGGYFEYANTTGTVDDAYGVQTKVSSNGGSIVRGYGVYIDTVAGTSKWSLYASDSAAPSYFAGRVGIGTTTPGTAFDLNGAFSQRGMAAPAVSNSGEGRIYFDSTSNTFKISQHGSAYADLIGGGGAPTGSAGGDLGGTYPNPTVAKIQSVAVDTTTPTDGQVLQYVGGGTAKWVPKNFNVGSLVTAAGAQQFSGSSSCASNQTLTWSALTDTFTCSNITGLASGTTGGAIATSANGTAAAPTFSFFGDADTGWFRAAADTLAAATAGSERIRIDSSGNVGIGTTGPAARLDIVGASPGTLNAPTALSVIGGTAGSMSGRGGDSSITGGPGDYGGDILLSGGTGHSTVAGGSTLTLKGGVWGGNGGDATLSGGSGGSGQIGGTLYLKGGPGSGASGLGAVIQLKPGLYPTGGGDAMIDGGDRGSGGVHGNVLLASSRGSVGIGTTAPGSALDVKGTLRLSGSTSGYVGFAPAAAAGSTTYTLPSADGSTGQVLSTNGSGVLSWASASGGLPAAAGTAGAPGYAFSGDTDTGMFGAAANQIGLATAGSERVRIDSNGNVGIGTTSPAGKLDVRGGTAASGSGSSINIIAENGETGSPSAGGNVNITAGTAAGATGGSIGGSVLLTGGTSSAYGISGARVVVGGAIGSGPTAAVLTLEGGGASNGAAGGAVAISGGTSSFGNGGNVTLDGGTGNSGTNGNILLGSSRGKVGIGTTNPTKSLVVSQTSGTDGVHITGTSMGSNGGTGLLLTVGTNAAGNKQLIVGDYDYIGSSSGYFNRFGVTAGYAYFDVVRGDGVAYGTINLGTAGGSKVAVGGDHSTNLNPSSLLWVNGNAAVGTNYRTVSAPTDGLLVEGKVGIGTSTPTAKLDVTGQIVSRAYDNGSATTFNMNNGNAQYTSASCGAMTLQNMVDGGSYTIAVQGATAGTCTFTDVAGSRTFKFQPANAASTVNTHTLYSMQVMGSYVYVTWISGY